MPSLLLSKAEQKAKNAENFPEIFGSVNLTSIRENVGEILKLIGRDGIFHEYTLHDWNHIDAILSLVDKLIPADTASKMKTADWLIIVMSCYFHDLGMVVTKQEFENRNKCPEFLAFKADLLAEDKGKDYEESLVKLKDIDREEFLYQEFVRKFHAKRVSHWIRGQDAPQFGDAKDAVAAVNDLLAGLEQIFRDDLAKICLSHHEDDLFEFEKYQINRVYGEDPNGEGEANLHYAALILRSADILQIQKKRVPSVLYKLIDPSNPKSQEEWAKQAGVRAIKPKMSVTGEETDTIEVHASFDKESAYFGLLAYLQQYASKELERCYDWGILAQKKGATFRFPWRQIDSSQVEPRGFEGRTYKFTLDQEKILKLLTGHTLYNDPQVAIREVLQNALDAVRFRKFLNPEEQLGKIEVIWDSKARILIIRDTGTGMTQAIIEKYLLNIGSSFYQSEAVLQKHSSFSSISRFGIGILSTFMIADEVQILTIHPDDEYARKITLPSVVKSYLIKKILKTDPMLSAIGLHGTEVRLQVRRSAELKDVEALIRYWMVIPGCSLTCKTDNETPVNVGFVNSKDVLLHYYKEQEQKKVWKVQAEIREDSELGIDLTYMVQKSEFADAWDFALGMQSNSESDVANHLSLPPGMCVEGVRVRSDPPGYNEGDILPWIFVNLTGRDAPKTNVTRSDVEQTPELDNALFRIYSLLCRHVQNEFNRLRSKGISIAEAAWEADYIIQNGLMMGRISNRGKFEEAMANLRVIALEEKDICHEATKIEIETFDSIWTVDGRLIQNIEGISGTLGINISAEKIVEAIGKKIKPAIPAPRLLGSSIRPLQKFEISSIRIYPEERSHRIDICWEKKKPGRWIAIPYNIAKKISSFSRRPSPYNRYDTFYIAREKDISSACPGYDMVVWRSCCFIFAASGVSDLLDLFGLTDKFARWMAELLEFGEISNDHRPLLKEQLIAAKGIRAEELLTQLKLPFERRFGDYRNKSLRSSHFFT